jgi:CBS domain-containing protein
MRTVGGILAKKKTQDVCTIGPDATVFDAIKVFAEQNLGALIVTEAEHLLGLVTERDYTRKVILKERSSRTTRVRDIMVTDVLYVTRDSTIEECMALMTNKFIRHFPVLDAGRLVGIVSMGDVVKGMLDERDFTIEELMRYIADSPMTSRAQQRDQKYGVAAEVDPNTSH